MALPTRRFFFRLALIYLLDWVVILGTIGFAGSTALWVTPNARPFSATDPDISFPFQTKTKIPTWLLVVCSVIIPGGVIAVLALGAPSNTQPNAQSYTTAQGWKRRFYCLNTAWLGLGLSLATAILITNGVKNLVGRPRPDLLSRCQFNQSEIQQFTVGENQLLDWHICKGSNETVSSVSGVTTGPDIRDGFRSFPSGHCSMSFAGLTYLAIFLAEFVFALPLPHLASQDPVSAPIVGNGTGQPRRSSYASAAPVVGGGENPQERGTPLPKFPIMGAILICGVPVMLAMYIATTRFSDFRHHGTDILCGSILGILSAFLGWRWYGAWTTCAQGDGRVYRYPRDRVTGYQVVDQKQEVRGEEMPGLAV